MRDGGGPGEKFQVMTCLKSPFSGETQGPGALTLSSLAYLTEDKVEY